MMRVLVTGSKGFIGRKLCEQLEAAHIPYVEYEGEINDFLLLRDALINIDIVIHLASAEARGRERWLSWVDIEGTQTLLRAIQHRPIKRLIYVSRINADFHAVQSLLQAKGIIEDSIKKSSCPYTIVRSATLFGEGDRFTNGIAHLAWWSWPFVLLPAGGEASCQPLWVEDLARILVKVIQSETWTGKTISVAGGERLRYAEVVESVLEAAAIKRRPISLSMLGMRLINHLTAWHWDFPPRHGFDLDRFNVTEVTPLDIVNSQFGFEPARLRQHLAHLHRRSFGRF